MRQDNPSEWLQQFKLIQYCFNKIGESFGKHYTMEELYGRPLNYNPNNDPCFPMDLYVEDNL